MLRTAARLRSSPERIKRSTSRLVLRPRELYSLDTRVHSAASAMLLAAPFTAAEVGGRLDPGVLTGFCGVAMPALSAEAVRFMATERTSLRGVWCCWLFALDRFERSGETRGAETGVCGFLSGSILGGTFCLFTGPPV